jgi:hypothetical protein
MCGFQDSAWDAIDIKDELESEITTEDHEICTDRCVCNSVFLLQSVVYKIFLMVTSTRKQVQIS